MKHTTIHETKSAGEDTKQKSALTNPPQDDEKDTETEHANDIKLVLKNETGDSKKQTGDRKKAGEQELSDDERNEDKTDMKSEASSSVSVAGNTATAIEQKPHTTSAGRFPENYISRFGFDPFDPNSKCVVDWDDPRQVLAIEGSLFYLKKEELVSLLQSREHAEMIRPGEQMKFKLAVSFVF